MWGSFPEVIQALNKAMLNYSSIPKSWIMSVETECEVSCPWWGSNLRRLGD